MTISFKHFLTEEAEVTQKDLDNIEKYLDQMFRSLNIDVEFTRHFLDRVNDERNGRQITVTELVSLFNKQFLQNGKIIAKIRPEAEIVLKDNRSDLNSPVVLEWNPVTKMVEMRAKTIMRKKNFFSKDKQLGVK